MSSWFIGTPYLLGKLHFGREVGYVFFPHFIIYFYFLVVFFPMCYFQIYIWLNGSVLPIGIWVLNRT